MCSPTVSLSFDAQSKLPLSLQLDFLIRRRPVALRPAWVEAGSWCHGLFRDDDDVTASWGPTAEKPKEVFGLMWSDCRVFKDISADRPKDWPLEINFTFLASRVHLKFEELGQTSAGCGFMHSFTWMVWIMLILNTIYKITPRHKVEGQKCLGGESCVTSTQLCQHLQLVKVACPLDRTGANLQLHRVCVHVSHPFCTYQFIFVDVSTRLSAALSPCVQKSHQDILILEPCGLEPSADSAVESNLQTNFSSCQWYWELGGPQKKNSPH